jgi:hypothetical protein
MERTALFCRAKRNTGDTSDLKNISKQYISSDGIDYDNQVKKIQMEITRFLLSEMSN